MAVRIYLVATEEVARHPTITELVEESTTFMGDGWKYPIGLLDHVRRHHGIMSSKDIAPFLIGYFVRHIMRQSRAALVVLPEQHHGHTYLATLRGAGVWLWNEAPDITGLRSEILECFLAHERMEAESRLKSAHNLLSKAFAYEDTGSALHQLVISTGQWEDADIALYR